MTLTELVALLVFCPVGVVAVVCSVGWWATVRPRLEHQQKMFALQEQAKLNAVTIQERHQSMLASPRSEYAASPQFYVQQPDTKEQ